MKNKHNLRGWIEFVCLKEERWWLEQGFVQTSDNRGWLQGVIFPVCSACLYHRGPREKIYLLQHGRVIYLLFWAPPAPPLSKNTFLMKSFICCGADCFYCEGMHIKMYKKTQNFSEGWSQSPDWGEACHVCVFACVMENLNVQDLVHWSLSCRDQRPGFHTQTLPHIHTRYKK